MQKIASFGLLALVLVLSSCDLAKGTPVAVTPEDPANYVSVTINGVTSTFSAGSQGQNFISTRYFESTGVAGAYENSWETDDDPPKAMKSHDLIASATVIEDWFAPWGNSVWLTIDSEEGDTAADVTSGRAILILDGIEYYDEDGSEVELTIDLSTFSATRITGTATGQFYAEGEGPAIAISFAFDVPVVLPAANYVSVTIDGVTNTFDAGPQGAITVVADNYESTGLATAFEYSWEDSSEEPPIKGKYHDLIASAAVITNWSEAWGNSAYLSIMSYEGDAAPDVTLGSASLEIDGIEYYAEGGGEVAVTIHLSTFSSTRITGTATGQFYAEGEGPAVTISFAFDVPVVLPTTGPM